jgi:16S rRNA (guanine1516-N2)-methyltransferase
MAYNFLPPIALYCQSSCKQRHQYTQQLHQQLGLPLLENSAESFLYLLVVTDTHVELQQTQAKTKPFYVDFLSAAFAYRRAKSSKKNELIARAVGIKGNEKLSVIDATAGLGQDSFILAGLGCHVQAIERSPVIAALLQDGIDRFLKSAVANVSLSLLKGDAMTYLEKLTTNNLPDVIYLDPMFPARDKSALVKKEMRILRDIVGDDLDGVALLDMALQRANKRVVVKRPRLAPTIKGPKPDCVFKGQSSRFDVYLLVR